MTLEQKAHDIGIAFATVKMQSRISTNNSDEYIIREAQYLDFINDYTFASSAVISGMTLIDKE